MQRRKSRRIEDSDEEIPRSGPDSPVAKKERLDDSDDDMPLFGPNGLAEKLAEKISQQEEEQESQLLVPEDYLKEEVAGLSQEELNADAVDEAEARLGIAESLASTPAKIALEVSRSFHDEEDIARTAAAKKKRFEGKDTLKISK